MDDVVTSIYSALEQEKASSLIMNNTTATSLNMAVHLASLSEDVVDLNDKAVACMIKKDFQGALETLQLALAKLTALQARPPLPALPVTLTWAQDEVVSPIASIPLTADNDDDDDDANDVNHERRSHHQDGIFVFFNRALLIPRHHITHPLHHCEHQDLDVFLASPKNQNRALATVLYNIALVYHMEANRRGCDTALFGHALNYYGWSYYVIESTSAEYGFQDVLLLLLALFNNMGQIHANVFVNSEKTRQCMKWMQSTFASKPIKRVLFPEDYKFFFQYISVVSQRQLRLAPAA